MASRRAWLTAEARELAASAGVEDAAEAMRKLVRAVLAEQQVQTAPVPVQSLFRWAGIRKLRQEDMVLEGALQRCESGGFDVIVRADRPATRRRFSIAHELGHIIFYKHAPRAKQARERARQCAPEEEERLCNVAAEEFLMPDWYMTKLAGGMTMAPAHMAAQVVRTCEVSMVAAAIRTARYSRRSGEVQLWRRDGADRRWKLSVACRTGRQRETLDHFRTEAWGDQPVPPAELPLSVTGWIYSAKTRTRILARTTVVQASARGDAVFVSHEPQRSIVRNESTLEEARRTNVRRALAAAAAPRCTDCNGTGWITPPYDPARRLAPASLCHCRYETPVAKIA